MTNPLASIVAASVFLFGFVFRAFDDVGFVERLLVDACVVGPVLWGMWRSAKHARDERRKLQEEHQAAVDRLVKMEPKLQKIVNELTPNGGHSVKDQVSALATIAPKILAETNSQTSKIDRIEQVVTPK